MNRPSFIIFKEARRFQVGYLDLGLEQDIKILMFRERNYYFFGQFAHFCQITDGKNRLVGFIVMDWTTKTNRPEFESWFNAAEGGLDEGGDFHFFIHWPCPEKWENDCSLLIGANVYHDGKGDFLIQIDDVKSQFATRNKFQNLWSEIFFPLAPAEQFVVKEYFPKGEIKSEKTRVT